MTGPEHYAEAERLLEDCSLVPSSEAEPAIYPSIEYTGEGGAGQNTCANALAAAQIHATLALAAATAHAGGLTLRGTLTTSWGQAVGS